MSGTAGGADHEMHAPESENLDPVTQAQADLWSALDDLSHGAQAATCRAVTEAVHALILAVVKDHADAG